MKAFLVMLFAVAFMGLTLWVVLGSPGEEENLDLVAKIVLITLWGIFSLITFIGGLLAFIYSSHSLDDYLQKTGITEEELNAEAENAKRFPSLLIGNKHIFVIAKRNFLVFPIANLEGLTVRAYGGASCKNKQDIEQVGGKIAAAVAINAVTGLNAARGKIRVGYYYLFFHGKDIPEGSKLYFALWPNMAKVIEALSQAKPDLEIVYH